MKPLVASKTFWVNFVLMVVAALVGISNSEVILEYPTLIPWVGGVIGGLNIVLRLFTKVPIQ